MSNAAETRAPAVGARGEHMDAIKTDEAQRQSETKSQRATAPTMAALLLGRLPGLEPGAACWCDDCTGDLLCGLCGQSKTTHWTEDGVVARTADGKPVCDDCACRYAPELLRTVIAARQQRVQTRAMLKRGLLEKYKARLPQEFVQFDGFALGPDAIDDVMHPDENGHCVMSTTTHELMRGSDVRVLIKPRTTQADAVALLGKIHAWCAESGFLSVAPSGDCCAFLGDDDDAFCPF